MWQCFLNVKKNLKLYGNRILRDRESSVITPSIHLADGVIQSHCTSFFLH